MTWTEIPGPLAGTTLHEDQKLPDVAFTDPQSGMAWRPASLRQRSALVLCFMHSDCEAWRDFLAALGELQDEIDWVGAVVRVVLDEAEPGPLPVVVDDGEGAARVLGADGQRPTLVVADRYGAAVASFPAGGHAFPSPQQVVAELRHLAMLCPECSV
jgi:hypothetical protein